MITMDYLQNFRQCLEQLQTRDHVECEPLNAHHKALLEMAGYKTRDTYKYRLIEPNIHDKTIVTKK